MAFILKDRVKENSTTTGTGNISLGGASATFDTFQSYLTNGDTTFYAIAHTSSGVDEWEVGLGTWNTGNTLSRTTVLAGSNGTSAVDLSAGTKDIFMTYPASKAAVVGEDVTFADITVTGTVDGRDVAADGSKLDGIDTSADVTDAVTVAAAGALMRSGGTMTGNLILNTDPNAALGAATKQYVDTIASAGIHYHAPVRAEHPSNLNATYNNGSSGVGATLTNAGTNAALVIDSVSMVLNDRVLVANQTNQTQNGVYTVTTVGDGSTAWVLTRSTDTDTAAPSDPDAFGKGDAFFIKEGSTNAGHLDVLSTSGTIVFGTTNIVFSEVAETTVYSGGTGITLTGTTFSIGQDVATSANVTFNQVTAAIIGNVTGNLTGDVTGNADTATALETARTIQLSGDVTGSASFDGSANINITAAVQDDSHAHLISNVDGLQNALDAKVPTSRTITAGNGLTGGGDLSANRTLTVGGGSGITVNANDIAIDSSYTGFDGRYYTETEADSRFVNVTGDTITGHLGIGGTATDANWGDSTHGNTEVSIDGGGGYGVLHFRGDGAGSTDTRYSVGVGDGIFYMAYDDVDGVHRAKINASHQLILNEGSGDQRAFHDGYHPNADKWTTARTLSLSGDASGSVSWDGSANATLSVAVANDSHTHDGRYYTETEADSRFVNVTGDTMTAPLTIDTNTSGMLRLSATNSSPWAIDLQRDDATNSRVYNGGGFWSFEHEPRYHNGGSFQKIFHDGYHPNADDADTLDGVQGNKYFTSYNNAGTTGWEDSNRNFRINSGGAQVGFAMHESDGTFGFQLYGDGSNYGFLDGNWGSWDIQKTINGSFKVDEGSGLQRVFNDAYHPNADKWTTARTLTLAGDVTGSVSWDGSANVTLTATVADDSHDLTWANIDGETANSVNSWGGLRHQTNDGYIDFGPANTGHAHIYTDRPNFYFNAELLVNNQQVFHTGYHPNADTLTTARTINGVSFNGSANITIADSTKLPLSGGTMSGALNLQSQKINFVSGAGGTSFGSNHYSMGIDYANGSWTHPNYSDLIIGYHTGIRLGAAYTGIRFYNNSPTTDSNNTGNGNGGEALIMTVGGTQGDHVNVNNNLTVEANLFAKNRLDVGTGSQSDAEIRIFKADNNVSDHIQFYNGTTRVGEIGVQDTDWLRINQFTAKNIYTPRYIRSDGGFFVDGTTKGINGSGNFIGGTIAGASDYATLLRSNANDTFTGTLTMGTQLALVAANYGRGVFGVYSPVRYQHVWSMGTAYKTNDSGTSYGNMYGLTYTHTNIGTGTNQAISGLSHQLQHRTNGTLTAAIGSGIWTSGNVTAYSDIAVKTNLVKIPNALEKVCSLNGYTYERTDYVKDKEDPEAPEVLRQAGVVAQEVEKVLPEVVSGKDGNKAVAYGNMVSILIEAIKEQQTQIDELKKRLK